jgi:hypothetical protein
MTHKPCEKNPMLHPIAGRLPAIAMEKTPVAVKTQDQSHIHFSR